MSTKSEIIKATTLAINGAIDHYFLNISSGQEKQQELGFIAELLSSQQPWLFFTEEALEATHNLTTRSSLNVNVMYNLTLTFFSRLALGHEDTEELISHLANCCDVKRCDDDRMSFMSNEYRSRLMTPDAHRHLMENNRNLIMLLCAVLYFDTNILVSHVKGKV